MEWPGAKMAHRTEGRWHDVLQCEANHERRRVQAKFPVLHRLDTFDFPNVPSVKTPKCKSPKTVEATENLWRAQYIEGAYRGEGIWTFEPVDSKTRLRFRWRVQPKQLTWAR